MNVHIGITTSFEDEEQRLPVAYVRAVERAGGLPIIVPMLENEAALEDFAELLDGLVIIGGPAVTDGLIGTLPEDINETHPVRTRADHRLLEAFWTGNRPVLGICYGMQLLNARAGGTLYADVERQVDGALVHSQKRGAETHPLIVEQGTCLYDLLGPHPADVNTRHIQAVADVADGFRIAGRAPDGTIEAIESDDGRLLGLQFHPERMGDVMQPLFRHLVDRARQAKAARQQTALVA